MESQHTFKVVQPSLCKGSQVSHPAMMQTPDDKMPIIHMYRWANQPHNSGRIPPPSPAAASLISRACPAPSGSPIACPASSLNVSPLPSSIELQQPLGLVSWWDTLHKDGVFEGQTFGFGIDAHWTSYIGHERHVVRRSGHSDTVRCLAAGWPAACHAADTGLWATRV